MVNYFPSDPLTMLCSDKVQIRYCSCDLYLFERLSHLPQEVLGELDGFIHGKIQAAVTDVLLNPTRKFPAFVCSGVTLCTGYTRVNFNLRPQLLLWNYF